MLRGLLPLIVKSDILLADALLATWWIVAEIRRRGEAQVQQGRRLTDFAQGRRLGQNDHVVEWPLPQRPKWMSLDDYAHCPAVLRVREVEVDGRILITRHSTHPHPSYSHYKTFKRKTILTHL